MSKGNLFLGMARGSVGDVTFYRTDGEQVARSRNRHPRNPRSARQAIIRAVNSSVSRIYAAGQVLFNHSFQGILPGRDTQRKFMSVNNRILRQMVLSDLANGTSKARLGVPGVSVAVPCPGIMVADGNYPQSLFQWDSTGLVYNLPSGLVADDETVAQYAARVGLIPGDIYTFGCLSLDNSGSAVPAWEDASGALDRSVWPSLFQFQQLLVKESVATDDTQIEGKTFAALFEDYKTVGEISLLTLAYDANIGLDTLTNLFSDNGCIFLIRSRFGEDKRSTSFLMPVQTVLDYGIKSDLVVAAWTNPAALQDPDLVLDGSEFVS